jgi:DNA polymerase-3 subunit delta'
MSEAPDGFVRALADGALADAWLLLAPGRRRCRSGALACAAALLGVREPRGHPDCAIFDPEELEVHGLRVEHVARRKEEVASVEDALRYKPLAGERRAVLLFDADRMNEDAQAALLKTAEEPPAGTFLLLTASDLGALLPALRSRCRVLRLPPEPAAALDRRAAESGIGAGEWALLSTTIGGEATLELGAEARTELVESLQSVRAWIAGEDPAVGWLALAEGSANTAEAREALALRLQAAMALILREDAQLLRADRWADLLDAALADLAVNVNPGLLLAGLRDEAAKMDLAPPSSLS